MTKKNDILSIDFDDNDDVDYIAFTTYLKDDTKRRKDNTFKEIDRMGEDYLKELEEKKARQNIQKAKYVKYIVKHNKGIYTPERLMSYDYADVQHIYQELKSQKESKLKTFFNFFFGL